MKINIHQYSLYLLLVLSILLNACNMVTPAHPTITAPVDEPQAAEPAEGTLMTWVDGSTLVYFDFCTISTSGDCSTPDHRWVYKFEVTNYQFSLCVESGNCQPPENSPTFPDFKSPDQANLPAQIIGPETRQEYCNWSGGRVLTNEEAAAVGTKVLPFGEVDTNPILIGLLSPGSIKGLRCIVDAPAPMVAACQTSAYYVNGTSPERDYLVTQAGEFCQTGLGFVTLDINLPEGTSIQSVNGDCEVVGENRVLCHGQPGSSGEGNAIIQEDNPSSWEKQCAPGYEPSPDAPALCIFNKLLPAVDNYPLPAIEEIQSSQSQGADNGSLIVYQPSTNRRDCPSGQQINPATGRCEDIPPCLGSAHFDRNTGLCTTATNTPLPDCAHIRPGTYFNPLTGTCENIPCPDGYGWNPASGVCYPSEANAQLVPCPIGYYREPDTRLCVSLNPQPQSGNECLGGSHFDDNAQCCLSDLPSGRYAGCPAGQVIDPSTGTCDSENIWVAGGKVLQTVQFEFSVLSCEAKNNDGSEDGSGATACPNGKEPVCDSKGNCMCP